MGRRARHAQAGVMLIEALVGILIFSIGILALIGMQGVAVKHTVDSRYRSEAAFLATQIVGQMWVDQANVSSYDKDNSTAFVARDTWATAVSTTLPGVSTTRTNTMYPAIEVGPDVGNGLASNEVLVTVKWLQPGETETRQFQMRSMILGATS